MNDAIMDTGVYTAFEFVASHFSDACSDLFITQDLMIKWPITHQNISIKTNCSVISIMLC